MIILEKTLRRFVMQRGSFVLATALCREQECNRFGVGKAEGAVAGGRRGWVPIQCPLIGL